MNHRTVSMPIALARIAALSVPLALVPIVGPVAASWLGGRGARDGALTAAVIVAVAWTVGLWWVSGQSANVSGTTVTLGPLLFVAPVLAAGLIAGGLCAAGKRGSVGTAVVILIAGTTWSGYQFGPVWSLLGEFRAEPQVTARDTGGCPDNLRKLYAASRLYADSWDDMLPPADVWMDRISEYVGDEGAMRCPVVGDAASGKHGYAMNRDLDSVAIGQVAGPDETPLHYDSATLDRNANDAFSSLPKPGRHGGKNNAVYLDGHVAAMDAR